MAGCRNLSNQEVAQVDSYLTRLRDKVLFAFGLATGFRITELLSIRVKDVLQHGKIVDRVKVSRSNMKGGKWTREVVIGPSLKLSIIDLIIEQDLTPTDYLFKSRKGENKAISRVQAWTILSDAFDRAKMTGSLGTHSMRKTFAGKIFSALKFDLVKTQKALGHSSILSTVKYLPVDQEDIDEAILSLD